MTSRRTIIIGDLHGCVDELRELLDRCGLERSDRLISVGDVVAKGPDSRGTIALLRELGAEGVRGNHDAHVLRFRRGAASPGKPPKPEHQQVLDTLLEEDWAWLEALPLFIRLPEFGSVVVHAGLLPGVPLEAQDEETLLTVRSITRDGKPSKKLDAGDPWAKRWGGPDHVYFGHDAIRGLQQEPFATGLDTGCVYGNQLTACILPQRRLVQVQARRAYCDPRG